MQCRIPLLLIFISPPHKAKEENWSWNKSSVNYQKLLLPKWTLESFFQLYNVTSQNYAKCNCWQYELMHCIKSLSEVACKPSSSMSSLLNKPLFCYRESLIWIHKKLFHSLPCICSRRFLKKHLRTLLWHQLLPGNEYKQDLLYQSADKTIEFRLNQMQFAQSIYFLCFKSIKKATYIAKHIKNPHE